MREINRYRLRKLVENRIFDLYRYVIHNGDTTLCLSKAQAKRLLVKQMLEAGYSIEQVSAAVEVDRSYVRSVKQKKSSFSKNFLTAVKIFKSPIEVLKRSSKYDSYYKIHKTAAETLIIEDLARAGWTTTQIRKATGFSMRRIQRIKRRIMEND